MASRYRDIYVTAKAEEKPKDKKPSHFDMGFQFTLGALSAIGGTVLACIFLSWLLHECSGYHPYRY